MVAEEAANGSAMSASAKRRARLVDLEPDEAAAQIVAAHEGHNEWLDAFAAELERHRGAAALARVFGVWQLSGAEAARIFGVSRQAVSKWLEQGLPPERIEVAADLAAATDLLVHYLKRDRIAAVVRRTSDALGGKSLLDLLREGRSRDMLAACRAMFDFADVQT
jgi:predicted transcriptional regulator